MTKQRSLIALSVATIALIAGCANQGDRSSQWDRNMNDTRRGQLPDRKGMRPDRQVVTPPNGYPSAMSTIEEERTRVGFLPEKTYENVPVRNAEATPEERTVVRDTEITNRSAAPAPTKRNKITRKQRSGGVTMAPRKRVHRDRTVVRSAAVRKAVPAYIGRMREVEALNRLHHINQTEIALANLAISKAASSSIQATARQTKAESEQMDERVRALAEKRNIKLESYSAATYEVAVKNQLDATEARNFDSAFVAATNRAHKEASSDLSLARSEIRDSEIRGLIQTEMPRLQAHRYTPASYREKARASDSSSDLGR